MGASHDPDEFLTLQETADRLKVHYMTAYRWVRRGDLAAMKTGGRLRIRAADLTAFLAAREVEVGLPDTRRRRTNWPLHVTRLTAMLLEGAAIEAGRLVRKVVADGAPVGEVYVHLLTPALHEVGRRWAAGEIDVAVEHRATEIVRAIMARLGDAFRRRGPSRGVAITLTPAGERHGLGAAMVADFLRGAGYDVHHLGCDLPAAGLEVFLKVLPADVVAISVTNPEVDHEQLAATVQAACSQPTAVPTVVVGGQGVDAEVAAAVGAVHVTDLRVLSATLDTLAQTSRRPPDYRNTITATLTRTKTAPTTSSR